MFECNQFHDKLFISLLLSSKASWSGEILISHLRNWGKGVWTKESEIIIFMLIADVFSAPMNKISSEKGITQTTLNDNIT